MIPVFVTGASQNTSGLIQLSQRVQKCFFFTRQPRSEAVRLQVTDSPGNDLFQADRATGVTISTWQSEGISRYAHLPCDAYLLVCSLLGLTQWRALTLNPLLVEEDFIHGTPSTCLFSSRPFKQDYALLFEEPHVCSGCLAFLRCLGAEPEVEALLQALSLVNSAVHPSYAAKIQS